MYLVSANSPTVLYKIVYDNDIVASERMCFKRVLLLDLVDMLE